MSDPQFLDVADFMEKFEPMVLECCELEDRSDVVSEAILDFGANMCAIKCAASSILGENEDDIEPKHIDPDTILLVIDVLLKVIESCDERRVHRFAVNMLKKRKMFLNIFLRRMRGQLRKELDMGYREAIHYSKLAGATILNIGDGIIPMLEEVLE